MEASSTGGFVPSPVRFAVVRKQLEKHGWVLVRINGSHHVFKKAGAEDVVVIPVHGGKVKPFYVRQVEKITQGG
jgi:predicted RNA binding protein YcfA (HicA-like mRNA interferase family)